MHLRSAKLSSSLLRLRALLHGDDDGLTAGARTGLFRRRSLRRRPDIAPPPSRRPVIPLETMSYFSIGQPDSQT